MSDNHL